MRNIGLYKTKGVMMRKLVVSLCILSIFISAVVLVGCGSGDKSSQTPEQVAKAFFEAYENLNADTMWDMMSANTQKTTGSKATLEEDLKESSGQMEFTVGEVTVNGSRATAELTVTASGEKITATVPLEKENGVWKVDSASMSDSTTQ